MLSLHTLLPIAMAGLSNAVPMQCKSKAVHPPSSISAQAADVVNVTKYKVIYNLSSAPAWGFHSMLIRMIPSWVSVMP